MSLKVAYGLAFLLVLLSLSAVAQPLPTRQGTSAAQRAEGEFARLVTIPTVCQTARERERERRRDCPAIQSCVSTMSSQVAAGVEYLKNNPAVLDALRNQARTDRCSIYGSFDFRLQALAKRLQQWARPLEVARPPSLHHLTCTVAQYGMTSAPYRFLVSKAIQLLGTLCWPRCVVSTRPLSSNIES